MCTAIVHRYLHTSVPDMRALLLRTSHTATAYFTSTVFVCRCALSYEHNEQSGEVFPICETPAGSSAQAHAAANSHTDRHNSTGSTYGAVHVSDTASDGASADNDASSAGSETDSDHGSDADDDGDSCSDDGGDDVSVTRLIRMRLSCACSVRVFEGVCQSTFISAVCP